MLSSTAISLLPILCIFSIVVAMYLARRWRFRKYNYDWYARTYPNLITRHGVKCFKCDSERLVVRNLLQQTFTKAHSCGRCGQTLYYSPER